MSIGDEVRAVSETGGEKGSKIARYDLIPPEALEQLAILYGRGAAKYEERNWERGFKYGLSFAAMMRHAWAFWRGQNEDEEMKVSHMACVAFHAFSILTLQARNLDGKWDDRGARS